MQTADRGLRPHPGGFRLDRIPRMALGDPFLCLKPQTRPAEVVRKPQSGDRRSEIGDRIPKSGIRRPQSGDRRSEIGDRRSATKICTGPRDPGRKPHPEERTPKAAGRRMRTGTGSRGTRAEMQSARVRRTTSTKETQQIDENPADRRPHSAERCGRKEK